METIENKYTIVCLRPINGIQIERLRIHVSNWVKTDYCIDWVEEHVDLSQYRYFWFEDRIAIKTYGDGIFTIRTKIQWQSGKYFINAYIEEYDDVVVRNQELAKQMTNLGWTHIVKNISVDNYWTEHYDPEKDKLIDFAGA